MLTKQISQATGQALIKEFATSTANIDAGYKTTKTFSRLEKGLETFIIKGAVSPAPEDVDLLDEVLIEFYSFANNLIKDLETNSEKYGGMSQFEKELIFNDQITQYQRKLKIDLQDEVGADLSDKEQTKDLINKDRDVYRKPRYSKRRNTSNTAKARAH